jgi:nitrate reductase assembly molybdenum cofactor insertion protein NarJ
MTSVHQTTGNEIAEALSEAAAWRMIGLLFECPHESWLDELQALTAEVANEELREAAECAAQAASEGLYRTTFGPGGPAAPREVSYRDSLLAGQILGELRAQYEAFAYAPALQEPPDHVAVMAGFMGYLNLKDAYARLDAAETQAETAASAAERFAAEHLSVMAQSLAESLALSGIRYLELASRALLRRTGPAGSLPMFVESEDGDSDC